MKSPLRTVASRGVWHLENARVSDELNGPRQTGRRRSGEVVESADPALARARRWTPRPRGRSPMRVVSASPRPRPRRSMVAGPGSGRGEEQLVVLPADRGGAGPGPASGYAAAIAAETGSARASRWSAIWLAAATCPASCARPSLRSMHDEATPASDAAERQPWLRATLSCIALAQQPGRPAEPPGLGASRTLQEQEPQPCIAERRRDPDRMSGPRARAEQRAPSQDLATDRDRQREARRAGSRCPPRATFPSNERARRTPPRASARPPSRKPRGTPSATSAHRGLAPIAARSERLTASALWPTSSSRLLAGGNARPRRPRRP